MKFTKKILKNGLRVVTVPMKDNKAVTVLVMVEAGARYEEKTTNGISHFLEHMVFKGTPRRPRATDIARELDTIGSEYNAFTSDEYTGYYAKVDKKHLDKALDIVSDMYLNPLFPEDEITKEKGVIIEEIRMYKDRPDRQVHDALGELMYGDQPAGWTVLGPEENIRSFSRKDFIAYRKKHYVPRATVVVVAGGIQEGDVHKKVAKIFGAIPADTKEGKEKVKESQEKPQTKVIYKDTGQTHVAFGIRGISLFDKRIPIMRVIGGVLGGGMSSRLFTKMRDELGICYYIRAGHNALTDFGLFTISAGIDTSRVELGITTILEEVARLKTELVSPVELKKVKEYMTAGAVLHLETSDDQADFVGNQELLKKEIKKPEEFMKLIQKVTAKDIQKVAQEFFTDERLNMAIIGPYKDPQRFENILRFPKE